MDPLQVTTVDGPQVLDTSALKVDKERGSSRVTISGIQRLWIAVRVKVRILIIALTTYRSFSKALRASQGLKEFRKSIYGMSKRRRCMKLDGKYFFALYMPAFPSKIFDQFIRTELNRILPHSGSVNRFQTLYFAITNKCPLNCEHCFEWSNLNKPETFTVGELKTLIGDFQKAGCTQFHFTGGEPLVRVKRLEELIRFASNASECWVLTSGHNLTIENATILKNAGATGVVISLDHFDPAIHNSFRGSDKAFSWAMNAVNNANSVKLLTAFSICLTRSFISEKNLRQYAKLARDCGVSFVQLLEPKRVGRYESADVALTAEQLKILDTFYIDINFNKKYKDYPTFTYHGFYQRRMGCLSGGKWSVYVDSAGYVDACPFCHTRTYNARDIISGKVNLDRLQMQGCPVYNNKSPSLVTMP
ncbi:MAG TPA: radical SAM protein [Chitinophagaceae bacterium]|nr:radical SAM protein [Chitinophagaceae bacterium]